MRRREKILKHLLLIIAAFIIAFPILYTFSMSFTDYEKQNNFSIIPSNVTFENYSVALQTAPLLKFILNSFIFAGVVTIGHLITSSLAAYAFVFIPFRGKSIVFMMILSTMMIPWEATIIPNFDTIVRLGWLNTFMGLIAPNLVLTLGIFLLRQHFLTLPRELHDAAQIDGCSRFRFFWQIVLPLSKPILAALGTYSFITSWNKYLWPLLVTNTNDIRTVQIGLKMLLAQEQNNNFSVIMAGIIMILLPTLIIFMIGHRYLQEGLASYSQK